MIMAKHRETTGKARNFGRNARARHGGCTRSAALSTVPMSIPAGCTTGVIRRARYRDIATQRSPYYNGRMMSGASAAVLTGSPGMLRCTLSVDARANADVEAANAGGEVDEDG